MPLHNKTIEKLKKKCLNKKYICSGEIYKLLETDTLERLIYFNLKDVDNFLDIIDKYVGYVRDNYRINHYELVKILEETLKNEYSKCIFEKLSIHDNIDYFMTCFKKMFLKNIFDNTLNYSNTDGSREYRFLARANKYLIKFNFDKHDDINKLEIFFIKVINNGKTDLYNCFKLFEKIDYIKIPFYISQLNWLYEEYY